MRRIRILFAALAAAVLVTSLAACSTTPSVEVADDAVIIDVRAPEEYAEGHLEGAINVNLQSGSFDQEIAEQPLDGAYVVYCRSGNRSAQAASIMTELGFTDVTDAGGITEASSATGIPIVTG
ncbi:rhodanese-like domain-containing protein [Microbacterium schleiferi]|uniref:Rhodanese-like domain-containing protein n=1 Tax=Microbacterium schleiferi TaxID=69362 RepID=A0A7S8MV07_9MICO|nr:rhodanese-like domain-containing protein [Microbacterium schleiferi]QPE03657.1 rhodanese-like domain-containing protein [Microbacterium schleiferi]